MTVTETLGPCERCEENAALTRFQVDHMHLSEPDSWACDFCTRCPSPLLCGGCTTTEAAEERQYLASAPRSLGERRATSWLRASATAEEQRWAS